MMSTETTSPEGRRYIWAQVAETAHYDITRACLDYLGHSCIYLGETPGDSRWKFRQGAKAVTVVGPFLATKIAPVGCLPVAMLA